ncbi:MAG: hypothetical protein EU548_07600 [Promethearchaeota archaeon]|nr:MAG: hypothetical protein EU548_07600 [Candidatus Lokiarchaeota archaeon]
MNLKPNLFLTSNVFSKNQIGKNEKINQDVRDKISELWNILLSISNLKVYDGRFPTSKEIEEITSNFKPHILGCHLSHKISKKVMESSNLIAVATCTTGFNHIHRTQEDNVIITHTPGVLHETVADYTIAIIMANLRNIIDLHSYLWNGNWTTEDKWDLDQNLSSILKTKTLGIVGLGEIGKEVIRYLYPWGLKIAYYDIKQMEDFEKSYPKIRFESKLENIFQESDIISLHVPLNSKTEKMIGERYLKLMKPNSLLINTARGGIINFSDLFDLLEKKELKINLSFDVYPDEPISSEILKRFRKIKQHQPNRRIILLPHNASADANTRGRMNVLFLQDIIKIIRSTKLDDFKEIHLIPAHQKNISAREWRILKYF